MFRIIDGVAYEGVPSADRWHVSLVDLGHGHREACVQRAVDWTEVTSLSPLVDLGPLDANEAAASYEQHHEDEAEREEKNALRSARRAKTNVRRRCKALGLDTLLTLTYRGNQTDRELCRLHVKLFLVKMRAAYRSAKLGEFVYVGTFEQQKRGAWHVHFAVQRLPKLLAAVNGVKVKAHRVIRACWLRVTGEWGGNIDDGRRRFMAVKSAAKCAAYISKYVLKNFQAGVVDKASYTWSKCDVPKPTRLEFRDTCMRELIARVVVEWGCQEGRTLCTSWLSPFKDVFYIAAENPS